MSDAVRTHILEPFNVKAWITLADVSEYENVHILQQLVLGHVLYTEIQYLASNIRFDNTYLPDHDIGNSQEFQ